MITRHYDAPELMETMAPYIDEIEGFEPEGWLADKDNICLTDGAGNFTLFERELPHAVFGHYFLVYRGAKAFELCQEFLKEIFTGPYGVEMILGLTPHDKKGALFMNKKLGFKSKGTVETIIGPCEMVALTKKEWANE